MGHPLRLWDGDPGPNRRRNRRECPGSRENKHSLTVTREQALALAEREKLGRRATLRPTRPSVTRAGDGGAADGSRTASTPWKGVALPLSYRRPPAGGGPAPVTVCRRHRTSPSRRGGPAASGLEALGDRVQPVAEVVELEDEDIVLPAVDAGCERRYSTIITMRCSPMRRRRRRRVVDVALAVGRIVCLLVGGPAPAAHVVPLTALLTAPVELLDVLGLTARTTRLVHGDRKQRV